MKVSGALAWHPEVAMSQEEIDDFLSDRWVARLATIGPDGYPHVSPLWYYWDGRCVYMALTHTRRPCKHLRSNLAKAVIITGEAELTAVGSEHTVTIEAGPWQGEYRPEQVVAMIGSRYPLSSRDGALGFTLESYRELFSQPGIVHSQLFKDNVGRVVTKITPTKIQAWDFSKAPIGTTDNA